MVFGLKGDIVIFGALALFLVSQKDKIASGIAGTGQFLGESFSAGFDNFFDSFSFNQNEANAESIRTDNGTPAEPDLDAAGALAADELEGATSISQDAQGAIFVNGEQVRDPVDNPEPTFIDSITDFFGSLNPFPSIPEAGAQESQQQTVIEPLPEERPLNLSEFGNIESRSPEIVSELPTKQTFEGGGVSFIGGTIRENPIDTLSEVLIEFPELTASQAADFLNEFSGILPSQVDKIDPDVTNLTANIDGQNVQVENVSVSDLDAEAQRAACTTCSLFGLNCDECTARNL